MKLKQLSLYKKIIAANILIIMICVIGGALISRQIMMMMASNSNILKFPQVIAKQLIDESDNQTGKTDAMKSIVEDETFPATLWVFDDKLDVKYSNTKEPLPKFLSSQLNKMTGSVELGFRKGIIAYKDINRFLYYKDRLHHKIKPHVVWIGTMLVSITFGMSILAMLIFYYFRRNYSTANHVITELKEGNLKARFPVKKLDEVGLVMTSFNSMADEVERLVNELKHADTVRTNLLQELAHDLRTPVSSLKMMLETVSTKWDDKDLKTEEIKNKFIDLSLQEVNYFARLVEDLLFLGRVSEPKYNLKTETLSVTSLINSEIDLVSSRFQSIDFNHTGDDFSILGDSHLLGRLTRNALLNASSYAKDKIEVSTKDNSIIIEDNGPGFSDEILQSFGERKYSRIMETDKLSVGLGSVIMKRITEIHNGTIQVSNSVSGGAIVKITFK
jgi:signal transduction histidine kinase